MELKPQKSCIVKNLISFLLSFLLSQSRRDHPPWRSQGCEGFFRKVHHRLVSFPGGSALSGDAVGNLSKSIRMVMVYKALCVLYIERELYVTMKFEDENNKVV